MTRAQKKPTSKIFRRSISKSADRSRDKDSRDFNSPEKNDFRSTGRNSRKSPELGRSRETNDRSWDRKDVNSRDNSRDRDDNSRDYSRGGYINGYRSGGQTKTYDKHGLEIYSGVGAQMSGAERITGVVCSVLITSLIALVM